MRRLRLVRLKLAGLLRTDAARACAFFFVGLLMASPAGTLQAQSRQSAPPQTAQSHSVQPAEPAAGQAAQTSSQPSQDDDQAVEDLMDEPRRDDQAQPAIPQPVKASDPHRQQINDQCANLLAMANALKSEVDKTSKEELSVAVVRKAAEIEQLARKVRDEMRPTMGKN